MYFGAILEQCNKIIIIKEHSLLNFLDFFFLFQFFDFIVIQNMYKLHIWTFKPVVYSDDRDAFSFPV